jgi:hypothetical protein
MYVRSNDLNQKVDDFPDGHNSFSQNSAVWLTL